LAFRAGWERGDLSIVHINEVKGGSHTSAHLLEFDSVHGTWPRRIKANQDALSVEGQQISFSEASQPGEVPWEASGVDLVLECSGKMLTPKHRAPTSSGEIAR
jgi:glyceraldehyde 3-phosphate dehydrogenase